MIKTGRFTVWNSLNMDICKKSCRDKKRKSLRRHLARCESISRMHSVIYQRKVFFVATISPGSFLEQSDPLWITLARPDGRSGTLNGLIVTLHYSCSFSCGRLGKVGILGVSLRKLIVYQPSTKNQENVYKMTCEKKNHSRKMFSDRELLSRSN